MSIGDESTGSVDWIINADSLRVTFDSGPRAGTSWRVQDSIARAALRSGVGRWIGQSAVEVVDAAGFGLGGIVRLTEFGLDQYGRLVGTIESLDLGDDLGSVLQVEGYTTSPVFVTVGSTTTINWPTLGPGVVRTTPIIVDRSKP